jgi:ATP-binding cassette subfamily C protein CydD
VKSEQPAVTSTSAAASAEAEERVKAREHSRWLSTQARTPRGLLAVAAGAPLLAGGLLLVQALLLARVLDVAIVSQAPRSELVIDISIIVVLILVRAGLAWMSERAGARAAEEIKHSIRLALFDRLVDRGPMWSRTKVSGELASAVVDQVEALDGFFSRYLPAAVSAAILPLAFGVVLLPFSWVAGLLLLVTAPLIPLFMALVGWGAEAASRRHFRAFARLSGFFADRLRGLSTLKLYGRAQAEAEAVVSASEKVRQRTMSVLRIAFLSSAVLEFFAALGVAGMAVYFGLTFLGFIDVWGSPVTLQIGFFCLLMAPEAYAPLRQFAAHYHDRASARAAASQIATVFDGLPEMNPKDKGQVHQKDAASATPERGASAARLTLKVLSVRTPNRVVPILNGASLAVSSGDHVAVVGPSGIGKTTLLEIIAGLRTYQGQVSIDDRSLADWDEASLRERVALIGQKPFLFAGTIAENIKLGRAGATKEEVDEAARRACVVEFTNTLPNGLDTVLGPRGRGLSGGQAQRVALARLFLRDPGLILLDEPTAHLDEALQGRVMDEILAFSRGRTLVLVTHSSSVTQRFPRVVRMAGGRLESL